MLYFKSVMMIEGWMEFWGGCRFKTTPKDCGDSTSSLYNLRYIHSKIKEHMMPKCLTNDEAYPGKECLWKDKGWMQHKFTHWVGRIPVEECDCCGVPILASFKQFLNLGSSADVDHLLTLRLFLSNSSQLWSVLWSVGLAPVPDRFIHSTRRAQEETWAGNPWCWIFSRKGIDFCLLLDF